jgi:hypothetical protein
MNLVTSPIQLSIKTVKCERWAIVGDSKLTRRWDKYERRLRCNHTLTPCIDGSHHLRISDGPLQGANYS